MPKFVVALNAAANEMAREEILKQISYLSRDIHSVKFSAVGDRLEFDAPEDEGPALQGHIESLAGRLAIALRTLQRKIEFRSAAAEQNARFAGNVALEGAHFLNPGQVVLEGRPLALYRYFDRVLECFGASWNAKSMIAPSLISDHVLMDCDYFRSFPHQLMFMTHLGENFAAIHNFRSRYASSQELTEEATQYMAPLRTCLSPALCYHVYHVYAGKTIRAGGIIYGLCGKCFRFESSNVLDLRRLSEFTMREVVFVGGKDEVLDARDRSVRMMGEFLNEHALAAEIRTASDPFFVAPDAASKTYIQLRSDSKLEVSIFLPGASRTAAASHNYHSDFFGRAFKIRLENGTLAHSACVAFGLERWIYAFLAQHGSNVARWPDVVRNSPEIQALS